MARRQQSVFEDLMDIAAMLPWQVALALAVGSYFGFHHLASLPSPLIGARTPLQSLGDGLVRQLMISFSMILQYLVPLAFVLGAFMSARKRRRQSELHAQVASAPHRNALENMSWSEFEGLAAEVFRRKGYTVTERGGNGPDGGVDLVLHMGRDKYLVQCKQWKAVKVGVATVRELYGVMAAQGAVGGFLVASGAFTEDAHDFAEGRSIRLVNTEAMLGLVRETSGSTTVGYGKAQSPRCPKCGSEMVQRMAKRGDLAGTMFWGCSRYPACRGIGKG